jgi:hypothetical protein
MLPGEQDSGTTAIHLCQQPQSRAPFLFVEHFYLVILKLYEHKVQDNLRYLKENKNMVHANKAQR